MIILSIETSCDETAIAIIETNDRTVFVRSHIVLSQAKLHEHYGGVFPNLAKREHARALTPLLTQALAEAKLTTYAHTLSKETESGIIQKLSREADMCSALLSFLKTTPRPDIGALTVTSGPGLEPALWVGISFAEALAFAWNIPLYPGNHMEGHVAVAMLTPATEKLHAGEYTLTQPPFPALAFLVSGGHTELDLIRDVGQYERVGETRDDAVGEAYDKTARLLGLPYPGGPKIALLAQEARSFHTPSPVSLPRPMLKTDDFDFSFSGLKTAVRYAVEKISPLTETDKRGIAREFEDAVTEVLITKAHNAIIHYSAKSLILGGGVIANTHIRNAFARLADVHTIPLLLPDPTLSTDNALMIAIALHMRLLAGTAQPTTEPITADGTLSLTSEK
jgi:N6-L-threonylcarbamoyladenine synthase